jgi:hypothetical protein
MERQRQSETEKDRQRERQINKPNLNLNLFFRFLMDSADGPTVLSDFCAVCGDKASK